MLVNRCSSELSGHQNHERNQKVTTSPNDKRVGCGRGRPLKPKEGLNGPPKTLVAGAASLSFISQLASASRLLGMTKGRATVP